MSELKIENPDVADLPPSAKLVYLMIQEEGPLTRADIRARTFLGDGTISDALAALQEAGSIVDESASGDARRTTYRLPRE